ESGAENDAQTKRENEPEIGFNFGQHAGDWTEDRDESAQPQRPSVAMSEPKEHADSAPKPSIAMSEPKDTKSQASTSGETQRPVAEEPAEAERKSARRPSEDDTTELHSGRHHKPPSRKRQRLVRRGDRLVKNQRKQSGSLSVGQVRVRRPKFPAGAITNHRKRMMKVGMLRGGIIRKPPATLMRNSLRLGSQRTIKTATPVKIITK